MTDIFISYASDDRERAAQFAQAFGAMGWTVWWDRKILIGEAYDQAIEEALNAAKCVVVLWSRRSTASEWVKNEAAVGAKRGVLVPARIDAVTLPLEFSRKQTADLIHWQGDPADAGFQALCDGVAAALGGSRPEARIPPAPAPRLGRRWIVPLILVAAVGYGVYRFIPRTAGHDDAQRPPTNQTTHPPPKTDSPTDAGELAFLVAGTYLGNIISDAKGSSQSDVLVTVTRIDRTHVRVYSYNPRIGTLQVALTQIGDNLHNAGGDSTLIVYPTKNPPELVLTARGEVSYSGTKR